jgi:hypothetical protein
MDRSDDGGRGWIDELSDSQCMEIFWLYVDPPEEFLSRYPPALLGRAMRQALRQVVEWSDVSAGVPR